METLNRTKALFLSEKNYWTTLHLFRRKAHFYPNIRRYRAHFEVARLFRKYLYPGEGKKVLEIGCGNSIWLPYLCKELKYEVYGIDYSEEGIEGARENLISAGCSGTLYCLDFFEIDEDFYSHFDSVFSTGVVEHFDKPEEVIRLFAKLLKKGGVLLTWVPNTSGITMKFQKMIDKEVYSIHKRFNLKELVEFHRKSGLKVIDSSYAQFLDFSIINLRIFNLQIQKWISRLITEFNFPLRFIEQIFGGYTKSRRWSSSMYIVAVK
ncbi:MAG: class I SAM-dependent methyltransferase [Candidatus Edwardsbacteria bacterium]